MKCRVSGCTSSNDNKASNISFFVFPADDNLAGEWVEFCRQNKPFNLATSVICMKHFTVDDFENLTQYNMGFAKKRALKRGAVPTIFETDALAIHFRPPATTYKAQMPTKNLLINHETIPKTFPKPSSSKDPLDQPEDTDFRKNNLRVHASNSELKKLKRKIELLQMENEKQRVNISVLKRKSSQQRNRDALEIESLQKRLKSTTEGMNNMEEKLSCIFTKRQIADMKAGSKQQNWTQQDIPQSITLYAISPGAYRLMYKQGFPLPSVATLKSWVKKFNISRGLLKPVLCLLAAATHMNSVQKMCVLSFGEMIVTESDGFILPDSTLSPTSNVQVVMLRGLVSNWHQPIFYDFDRKMTYDLLKHILREVENCGYIVVAVVCDQVPNKSLYNNLMITEDQPWFILTQQKIFFFAAVPNLLKTLCKHFLVEGFLINGKPVKKEIISHLLSCSPADFTTTHEISESDLNTPEYLCQNVNTAAKLFSHTLAQAITKAASLGHLQDHNWSECFQLFKITSDWFDVLNVKVSHADSRKHCHAYGLSIREQDKILNQMTALIKSLRVIGKPNLLPFQREIIQTNTALKLLLQDIKNRYNLNYILTFHLNQHELESLFDIISSNSGSLVQLDQEEFQCLLRQYLLGHLRGDTSFSGNANDASRRETTKPPLTSILLKNLSSGPDLQIDGVAHLSQYICTSPNNVVESYS